MNELWRICVNDLRQQYPSVPATEILLHARDCPGKNPTPDVTYRASSEGSFDDPDGWQKTTSFRHVCRIRISERGLESNGREVGRRWRLGPLPVSCSLLIQHEGSRWRTPVTAAISSLIKLPIPAGTTTSVALEVTWRRGTAGTLPGRAR